MEQGEERASGEWRGEGNGVGRRQRRVHLWPEYVKRSSVVGDRNCREKERRTGERNRRAW
jgi:hypothetical protein